MLLTIVHNIEHLNIIVNIFNLMSCDINANKLVGVRLTPVTLEAIDEKRKTTGATRQDFIRTAIYTALERK